MARKDSTVAAAPRGFSDVIGIVLIAGALLLLVAQLSFDRYDVDSNRVPANPNAHNLIGRAGAFGANALFQMFGGGALAPLVLSYGSHPITSSLTRNMTIFPLAREVKVGKETGSGIDAQSLLSTSEQSWGEAEIKPGVAPKFDQGIDHQGPVTLGVAASKNMGENKEGRLVVIGDSDFASNRAFGFQRNGDLFLNSVNWLAQDEDLIAIRPKSAANRSVTMTESQQRTFFWFSVALLPLLVIGSGVYVWWKRR